MKHVAIALCFCSVLAAPCTAFAAQAYFQVTAIVIQCPRVEIVRACEQDHRCCDLVDDFADAGELSMESQVRLNSAIITARDSSGSMTVIVNSDKNQFAEVE